MTRKAVWRDAALDDLERIDAWLSGLEHARPTAARARIGAAVDLVERLGDIVDRGVVRERGNCPCAVRRAPYVIVYRIDEDDIDIVAVYHTAENR